MSTDDIGSCFKINKDTLSRQDWVRMLPVCCTGFALWLSPEESFLERSRPNSVGVLLLPRRLRCAHSCTFLLCTYDVICGFANYVQIAVKLCCNVDTAAPGTIPETFTKNARSRYLQPNCYPLPLIIHSTERISFSLVVISPPLSSCDY